MGYLSAYFVQAHKNNVLDEDLLGWLETTFELTEHNAQWDFLEGKYAFINDIKWYDFKKDLTTYSESFPESIITVTRFGEEHGDIERVYFKNGKMQESKAKISFDECQFEREVKDA